MPIPTEKAATSAARPSRLKKVRNCLVSLGRRLFWRLVRLVAREEFVLERTLRSIERPYWKELAKAKNEDEEHGIMSELSFETEGLREQLNAAKSRRVVRAARRREIPTPPISSGSSPEESWEYQRGIREWALIEEARRALWLKIREDRKQQADYWYTRLKVATAVIAIGGAVYALVSWLWTHLLR